MKYCFISLFSILISCSISAQESKDKKVFLDSLWKETSEANHKYYRIIKDYYSDQTSYKILDYYKSGAIQMEGSTNNKETLTKSGDYVYYYENGKKKAQYYYERSFTIGKFYTWYENGNPESEGEYLKNAKNEPFAGPPIMHQYWDENNVKTVTDGNGTIKGKMNDFYGSGNIRNGYKDGTWEAEFKNGKEKIVETYDLGKFILGVRTDENNVVTKYYEFEKKPIPKKGLNDFYEYIGKKFRYTKESIKDNIKGKMFLSFVVDSDGRIVETKIIKGLGYGLDEEAIRVVESYGKWIPGEQRGVKVRCLFSIPITLSGQQ